MADTKTEDYYIVEATLKEVKAFNGKVLTPEGKKEWLCISEGYPSFTTNEAVAKKFDEPPSRDHVANWDGMPWYCRIKGYRTHHIVRETTITTTREIVDEYHSD